MADYDELIGALRYLLTNKFAPKPAYTRGLLGDGLGNVVVPGKPDRSYVRFNRSTTEYFEIFNRTVNPVNGWPVLIGEFPWQPGLTQVVDTDRSAFEQSGWGDSLGDTSPHAPTHEWRPGAPGSDPMDVYTRALVPLRAYTLGSGSSTVYVNSYEYEYNLTGTVWGGLPGVDMTPIMGATATGTMRYAGIYLDPLTNTLGVVTGTTTVHSAAIEPPWVDFPADKLPSARVRIYGGQAAILEADMREARRPFNPTSGPGLVPAEGFLAADAFAFVVENRASGTVTNGELGYIDSNGYFLRTATAYDEVAWVVVLTGGAHQQDIYVARRGRVTVTLNGNCSAGDFLYTSTTAGQAQPQSYVRPEVFGVALTANGAGAGGTCEALLLCNRRDYPLTSTNDALDINGASDSDWQTTQNGAPAGAVVTYNTPLSAGAEDTIVPAAAGQLCQLVLHNVTQGEEAFIASVDTGANTITVTAAGDVAAWGNGDTLEVISQTNTDTLAAGIYFFDLYAASSEIPDLAVKLEFNWFYRDSGANNESCVLHPYVTGDSAKRFTITAQTANVFMRGYGFASLINRRFTIAWTASGAGTGRPILKLHRVTVAEP